MMNRIEDVLTNLEPLRHQLLNHDLYKYIETPDDLRVFTEHHVFAVWDFMSLVKTLQQKLSNVKIPWTPKANPECTYLINDIVLAEESDINWDGNRQSHFEMYLEAMKDINASTASIFDVIEQAEHGTDIFLVISKANMKKSVKAFLIFTFNTIYHKSTEEILAVFAFGREHLIPEIFTEIIESIQHKFRKDNISKLKYYFDRHIEIDPEKHRQAAIRLIENTCKKDIDKWNSIEKIALQSLEKRLELLNGIKKNILLNKAIA